MRALAQIVSRIRWRPSLFLLRCDALCARMQDDRGSALLEVAFVTALLAAPLLAGTSQMGFLVYDSIEVSSAAHTGALYAMQSSTYAADTTGITSAARAEAADFGANLTVNPSTYYACSNAEGGTQYTGASAQSNAQTACTGSGNHALEFVQVNTSATVTPPVHCPGLPNSYTLRGTSVMEVEQ